MYFKCFPQEDFPSFKVSLLSYLSSFNSKNLTYSPSLNVKLKILKPPGVSFQASFSLFYFSFIKNLNKKLYTKNNCWNIPQPEVSQSPFWLPIHLWAEVDFRAENRPAEWMLAKSHCKLMFRLLRLHLTHHWLSLNFHPIGKNKTLHNRW